MQRDRSSASVHKGQVNLKQKRFRTPPIQHNTSAKRLTLARPTPHATIISVRYLIIQAHKARMPTIAPYREDFKPDLVLQPFEYSDSMLQ